MAEGDITIKDGIQMREYQCAGCLSPFWRRYPSTGPTPVWCSGTCRGIAYRNAHPNRNIIRAEGRGTMYRTADGRVGYGILLDEEDLVHLTGPTDLDQDNHETEVVTLRLMLTVERSRRKVRRRL